LGKKESSFSEEKEAKRRLFFWRFFWAKWGVCYRAERELAGVIAAIPTMRAA
jgi:hypothetical protein